MPRGRPKCPYRTAAKLIGTPRYVDGAGVERFTRSGNKVTQKRAWQLAAARSRGALPKTKRSPEQFAKDNRDNVKRWREANPAKKLAQQRRRRAGMTGFVTPDDVAALRQRQDGQCFYCAGSMEPETFDHFIPVTLGGEHSISNGRLACGLCNSKKSNLPPREFFMRIWHSIG